MSEEIFLRFFYKDIVSYSDFFKIYGKFYVRFKVIISNFD